MALDGASDAGAAQQRAAARVARLVPEEQLHGPLVYARVAVTSAHDLRTVLDACAAMLRNGHGVFYEEGERVLCLLRRNDRSALLRWMAAKEAQLAALRAEVAAAGGDWEVWKHRLHVTTVYPGAIFRYGKSLRTRAEEHLTVTPRDATLPLLLVMAGLYLHAYVVFTRDDLEAAAAEVKAHCTAVGLDLAVAAEHAAGVGEIVTEDALGGNVAAGGAAVAPTGRGFGGGDKPNELWAIVAHMCGHLRRNPTPDMLLAASAAAADADADADAAPPAGASHAEQLAAPAAAGDEPQADGAALEAASSAAAGAWAEALTAAAADQPAVATLYALYTDPASSEGDRQMAASALVKLVLCVRRRPDAYPLHTITFGEAAAELSRERWEAHRVLARAAAVKALPKTASAAELRDLERLLQMASPTALRRLTRGNITLARLMAAAQAGDRAKAAESGAAFACTARTSDGVLVILFGGGMAPQLRVANSKQLHVFGSFSNNAPPRTMGLWVRRRRKYRACAYAIIVRIQDAGRPCSSGEPYHDMSNAPQTPYRVGDTVAYTVGAHDVVGPLTTSAVAGGAWSARAGAGGSGTGADATLPVAGAAATAAADAAATAAAAIEAADAAGGPALSRALGAAPPAAAVRAAADAAVAALADATKATVAAAAAAAEAAATVAAVAAAGAGRWASAAAAAAASAPPRKRGRPRSAACATPSRRRPCATPSLSSCGAPPAANT
jgi:hypothetical protein